MEYYSAIKNKYFREMGINGKKKNLSEVIQVQKHKHMWSLSHKEPNINSLVW